MKGKGALTVRLGDTAVRPIVTMLERGTPADVRECLARMGDLLRSGIPLFDAERAWLARALIAIGEGENPMQVLRLKARGRPKGTNVSDDVGLIEAVADLVSQGATQDEACRLIAEARATEGWPGYTSATVESAGERLVRQYKAAQTARKSRAKQGDK